MNIRKWFMGAAVAALSATAPSLAKADLIQFWDYTATSTWTNFQPSGDVDSFMDGTDHVIEWGGATTGGRSNLRVTNNVSGPIEAFTSGTPTPAPGATITHNNWPITQPFLTSTDLAVEVTFTPSGGTGTESFSQLFNIEFEETWNREPCDDASVSVCDDVFTLLNPDQLVVEFLRDGYIYTAQLVFLGFEGGQIFEDDIDGDGNMELYFLTEENATSVLRTGIILTARVPEPAAIGLFGAGIAGLGLLARRRRKA